MSKARAITQGAVRLADRFITIDILRGVALLGILLANIEDFSGPESLWDIPLGTAKASFVGWHAHLDLVIVTLKWLFTEGKMRSLFAILYGASVVLLTERLERRAPEQVAKTFYRRSIYLCVFGLLHAILLWWGDILVDYALLGMIFLYPIRRLGAKHLITIGLIVWVLGGSFGVFRAFHITDAIRIEVQARTIQPEASANNLHHEDVSDIAVRMSRSPEVAAKLKPSTKPYLERLPDQAAGEFRFLSFKFLSGWALEWLGAMITGMGLYKSGFLLNQRPTREYLNIAVVGYLVSWLIVLVGLRKAWESGLTETAQSTWMLAPYSLQVAFGTLANLATILLLVRKGRFKKIAAACANVGRMAFSNYVLTTVLCEYIFKWSTLKLYGRLEYYQTLLVVWLVWSFLIAFSSLWLRVFAFGPLEWVWRSLTYGRCQPMLLQRAATYATPP